LKVIPGYALFRRIGKSSLLQAFRFQSWIVGAFIFGFGSVLFCLPNLTVIPIAFSLSLVTASISILSQLMDRERDKLNPRNKVLPISCGKLSIRKAKFLVVFLLVIGCLLASVVDITITPLIATYFVFAMLYSVPPFCLKGRPILDILVVGVVSGIFPFIIGLQVSHQLTLDFSLPWIRRRYQDTFFAVIPIFLFQMACHIFHTIEDYEADKRTNICTFAVRFGKKVSAGIGILFVMICLVLPIIYSHFDLFITKETGFWYSIYLIIFFPFILFLMNLCRNPTKKNLGLLRKISKFVAPVVFAILFFSILILRIMLPIIS
jgi:4-hydroxybenzoate polyprenyltransferase